MKLNQIKQNNEIIESNFNTNVGQTIFGKQKMCFLDLTLESRIPTRWYKDRIDLMIGDNITLIHDVP